MSATPAPAASVLLSAGPQSPSLYVVRRADRLRFFGGFHAFPGGKVSTPDRQSASPTVDARAVCAARELFEETGVLVARQADGSFPASGAILDRARRLLLDGHLEWPQLLRDHGLSVRPSDLTPVGNLVTPPFTALRFDTTFFTADCPPGQTPEVWPGELSAGEWTTAAALLDRWVGGQCHVAPPSLVILQGLRSRPTDDLASRLRPLLRRWMAAEMPPIFFAPEVQLLPLRTAALPPSTHTNAYLVGRDPAYLIDPGADDEKEQAKLFPELDKQQALGRRLAAVILTHQHPDHVGAAAACARRYGLPVWAHPRTAEALVGEVTVSRSLNDGDTVDLGVAPDGFDAWHLETIHTPGHAAGHLAFLEPHYHLLFVGDLISTQTSILINPPEGDLAVYLTSLRRLESLPCRLLLPAHGSPTALPRQAIKESLAHRAKREEQLLTALTEGPRQVPELARELYRGIPASLAGMAEQQVRAGLNKLLHEGRVRQLLPVEAETWDLLTEV